MSLGGRAHCREEDARPKMKNHEPNDTAKEKHIFDIIARKIDQLLETERNPPEHGLTYIVLTAALCGLIAVFFITS